MILFVGFLTDDERKSRYYLTRGESADPSEKFTDSFEDSASETYHFYHSLHPPNEGSSASNEALVEYSEVSPEDVQIYAMPEGCSPTLLQPPTIVVVQQEEEEEEEEKQGEGLQGEAVDHEMANPGNVCCLHVYIIACHGLKIDSAQN